MAVILKTLMAGPSGVRQPGERVNATSEQERALVEGGFAFYERPRTETAEAAPRENAAMSQVKRRRG